MTTLYIAYGANVLSSVMAERCPDARFLGRMVMRDYRLIFRGVADMVRAKDHTATVAVYELSEEDVKRLDKFESVPSRYVKRLIDLTLGGERRTAMMYVMNKGMKARGQQVPFEAYYDCLTEGYAERGMPQDEIAVAIELAASWTEANRAEGNPDPEFLSRVWTPVQGEVELVAAS